VRALAALGDTAGVPSVVRQRDAMNSTAQPDQGALWYLAANGVAVHAHADVRAHAGQYRARELAWFASRTGATRTPGVRWRHARALALSGEAAAARDSLASLSMSLGPVVELIGLRAAVAVLLGDESGASRLHEQLRAIDESRSVAARSVAEGDVDYWLAVSAALEGNAERAAASLQRAFSGWRGRDVAVESDPWFASVRRSAAFAVLLQLP
jgi:hypothetical protein